MNRSEEYLPRAGEFDPLADEEALSAARNGPPTRAGQPVEKKPRKPLVELWTPSQIRAYEPPADYCLIGDSHLQRGAVTVFAGPPSVGKSRAALWLGVLGAKGAGEWFGLKVNSQFRSLWIQEENRPVRLARDFKEIPDSLPLDDWLRVTVFRGFRGIEVNNPFFLADLKHAIREWEPTNVILDPWNTWVRDAMEKDFQEGFTRLREVLAEVPSEPACLISHHLRKPKAEDRQRGRTLAHLLSGSYVLHSKPRCVCVMQSASDDVTDDRIVFTVAKNNDGKEHTPRTAWTRKTWWFEPIPDAEFDWEAFDSGTTKREAKVKEEHIREVFENGRRRMALKQAAERLQEVASVGRSVAYEGLKLTGRFAALLVRDADGLIGLKPGESEPPSEAECP